MSDLPVDKQFFRVCNNFGSKVSAEEVLTPSLTCSLFSTFQMADNDSSCSARCLKPWRYITVPRERATFDTSNSGIDNA